MKTVQFKEWKCVVHKGQYKPKGTALMLDGAPGTEYEGEPIATASVNIYPEMYQNAQDVHFPFSKDLPKNQCYIKTWSENEGLLEALVEAGVVEKTPAVIPVGPYGSQATLVKIL